MNLPSTMVLSVCCYSVASDPLPPHELQHTRLPCPSLSLGVCSNSCPLSRWCHPTISSSVIPFSRLQSFPASGSFPMSRLFTSGGQSIGASASTSVLSVNIQGWFPLELTGLISLCHSSGEIFLGKGWYLKLFQLHEDHPGPEIQDRVTGVCPVFTQSLWET